MECIWTHASIHCFMRPQECFWTYFIHCFLSFYWCILFCFLFLLLLVFWLHCISSFILAFGNSTKNLGSLLFDVSLKLDAWNVNFLKSTIFQYFGTFRMYLRKHKPILILDFRPYICHNFWCWNHSTLTKLTFSEVQVIVGLSLLKFGSLV